MKKREIMRKKYEEKQKELHGPHVRVRGVRGQVLQCNI